MTPPAAGRMTTMQKLPTTSTLLASITSSSVAALGRMLGGNEPKPRYILHTRGPLWSSVSALLNPAAAPNLYQFPSFFGTLDGRPHTWLTTSAIESTLPIIL